MRIAVRSFFLTLAVIAAGLLLHWRISLREGESAEPAPGIAEPETARAAGGVLEKSLESEEARMTQLAEDARRITGERPIVGNIVKWWNIVCRMAETDPFAAIQSIREAPESYLGDEVHSISGTVESIVAWWAARDPAAALAWYWQDAAKHELPPWTPGEIIQTLARRDAAQAISFVRRFLAYQAEHGSQGSGGHSMTLDGLRVKTSTSLAPAIKALQPWLKTPADFEAILPLIEVIPDAVQRAGFHQSLTASLTASLTPGQAAAFLDSHPLPADWPADHAHPAATLVKRAIATGEPAAEWIAWGLRSIPNRADLRTQMAAGIVEAWTARDPESAGLWLREFSRSDPDAAIPAIRAYASASMKEDPAAAMAWITAIPDETVRRHNMLIHFPGWVQTDPAAARAWLASAKWPEEIKRLVAAVPAP